MEGYSDYLSHVIEGVQKGLWGEFILKLSPYTEALQLANIARLN